MPNQTAAAPAQAAPAEDISSAVARLRADFDRGFTLAPKPATDRSSRNDFVLLASGPARYALSTVGLAGIEHGVQVTPAPSRVAALLGLAGVRGAILPVLSLAGLLGLPVQTEAAWWRKPLFALATLPAEAETDPDPSEGQLIGLAFDRLLHSVRVPPQDLLAGEPGPSLEHQGELFIVLDAHRLIQPLLAAAQPAPAQPPTTENLHP